MCIIMHVLYCVGQAAVGVSTKISLIISKVLGILNLEIKKSIAVSTVVIGNTSQCVFFTDTIGLQ